MSSSPPMLNIVNNLVSVQNLTGGKNGGKHVTDVTNASRTMLMNIHTLKWDPYLCKYVHRSQRTPLVLGSPPVLSTQPPSTYRAQPPSI